MLYINHSKVATHGPTVHMYTGTRLPAGCCSQVATGPSLRMCLEGLYLEIKVIDFFLDGT